MCNCLLIGVAQYIDAWARPSLFLEIIPGGDNLTVVAWLRDKRFSTQRISIIWRGFIQTLPWLGGHLAWQVGNGNDIWIGVDPIIGAPSSSTLPEELRSFLEDLDIYTLSQAHNILPDSQNYWYTADELGIVGD